MYFCKILLALSWDINFNPVPVHGIEDENMIHVLPRYDWIFSGKGFYYNLRDRTLSM